MPKRFSRYRFAKKVSGGEAKANSALEKFLKYEKGEVTPIYNRAETSKPGSLAIVYLAPFGAKETEKYQAQISKRALDKRNDLIGSVNLFNHLVKGASDIINVNDNYVPAKAIIAVSGSGETSEISQITGQRYTKETGAASYTVPFGGSAAAGDNRLFTVVAKAIDAGVRAKNSEYRANFTPEIWKGF